MNIEGSRSFQNNFVQYSFTLSVLVPDLLTQLGIDLVYIAAIITGIIFSFVIIQVGILTFQFLKRKFLCWSNKAFLVFLRPHDPTTLDNRTNYIIIVIGHFSVIRILFRVSDAIESPLYAFYNGVIFSEFFTGRRRRSDQIKLFSFALCT